MPYPFNVLVVGTVFCSVFWAYACFPILLHSGAFMQRNRVPSAGGVSGGRECSERGDHNNWCMTHNAHWGLNERVCEGSVR